MTSTTNPSIYTIKSLPADLSKLRGLILEELTAISVFAYALAHERRSILYCGKTAPLRLAAQALGFPRGWSDSKEFAAAAAAGTAACAADDALQTVENREFLSALNRELRRQQSNKARLANADKRAALAVASGTYTVGEAVQVHAFGCWYSGVVVKLGRTGKVTVKYTSGTGVTREKAVGSNKVRKSA